MDISTKGRYGLRILLDIAQYAPNKKTLATMHDIARRQDIPIKYMGQILTLLQRAGFVSSVRGIKGGFSLKCDVEKITLLDIIEATEGRVAIVKCMRVKGCRRHVNCPTLPFWKILTEKIREQMKSITLTEMLAEAVAITERRRLATEEKKLARELAKATGSAVTDNSADDDNCNCSCACNCKDCDDKCDCGDDCDCGPECTCGCNDKKTK